MAAAEQLRLNDPLQQYAAAPVTVPRFGDRAITLLDLATHSSSDDMALWLHHTLAESDPAVWPTLALAHAVYRERQAITAAIGFDEAGPMAGLALGWVVVAAHGHTPLIMQKSGGGGGFMSHVAFVPGREIGLFVAVNRVDFTMFFGLSTAANELLATLAPR
jgi:serine-type D-Ala-D-Ala carboxypeptidase/endopeptidase